MSSRGGAGNAPRAAGGAIQTPAALWRLHFVLAWLPVFTLSLSWWLIRRFSLDEAAM